MGKLHRTKGGEDMLRVLELFGGIGACTQALKNLGIEYEVADYVEIDKYAVASYNVINGTNYETQDITKWDKNIEVDLIMHGSPCQDFSLSGKQAGGDEGSGTRSSLMYETIRIVEKLKPKYVIWENVKNLLSKKHRHNFDNYLEIMDNLGYNNYYQVLNAKDYGIPQNRERVFTVSIRKDIDTGYKFPEKEELQLKLKDMLEESVDEKYYLTPEKINKIAHWKGFQKPFEKVQGKNSICPTLTARGAGEEHNGMITYSALLEDTTNMQDECLRIRNNTNLRIRKLTPKECWRLMGFSDKAYEKAWQVNKDAKLYKQAGNSIVVNVIEKILKQLLKGE